MLALYQLLRSLQQPINLLALTGCETAVGNERDALGITGAALQAGVDTVMASLWQIDDQATGMIVPAFYQNLGQGQSKAKALQQAQINWLKVQKEGRQRHPGYWAPLILVGNWQ
jgi:CHAT domain-containing protein